MWYSHVRAASTHPAFSEIKVRVPKDTQARWLWAELFKRASFEASCEIGVCTVNYRLKISEMNIQSLICYSATVWDQHHVSATCVQCEQVHFNMTRTVCVDLNTLTFKILNETTFQKCFPGLWHLNPLRLETSLYSPLLHNKSDESRHI